MGDFGNRDILDANLNDPFEGAPTFSRSNRFKRAAFALTWLLLARWTPPPMSSWRNTILRLFGAQIHPSAKVYGSARIWLPMNLVMGANSSIGPCTNIYNMAQVKIGERVVISQGVHICAGTHDFRHRNFQLIVAPVTIKDGVWIATEAFVGPGVTIEADAVLGARAVATRDLRRNTVYVGNPAQHVRERYAEGQDA